MVSHQSIRLEFVKELDMNNHKLKPLLIQQIQSDKEPIIVEEPKECEICFNGLCNKVLTCKCCRKTICIDCCNNLPSREIRLMVNEDIVNDITKDFDTECEGIPQPTITYDCPYCRTNNLKSLIEFKKNPYDMIKIVLKDYIKFSNPNFFILGNEKDDLTKRIAIYDNIATLHYKDLMKEKKENYELKMKYNELLKDYETSRYENNYMKEKYNELVNIYNTTQDIFVNAVNRQEEVIKKIQEISKQKTIRNMKKDLANYMLTLTTMNLKTMKFNHI